jgi:hypothetical protein
MKSTGYDLFKKFMSKILNNYQEMILYHIEQDVDKILSEIKSAQIDFDKVSDNMDQINFRLKNLIATTYNKCKVEEIIQLNLKLKLDEITQLMNNYLISGINTYTGNSIENANSFLDKITKFFGKVSNLFKTNPLQSAEEKLKQKRIELLNNKLSESFNEEIFTELYTNKTLDLLKYTTCISNTIDKNLIKFDKLLETVNKTTNNDEKFMTVIINKFISSYKPTTVFSDFLKDLELIANAIKSNLEILWSIIECHLKTIMVASVYKVYQYWINLNSVNILQETDEVKYIMFKFNTYLTNYSLQKYEENIDSFKKNINDIQNLYKLLTKLIGKKPINIIDNDIELISPIKQATKEKLIEMTDDEFLDAIEGEKTEIENNNSEDKHNDSEKYHDSDDSDTVYQKAKKNTNVRTTRRVNKGSNVVNLNKQKIDKYYK